MGIAKLHIGAQHKCNFNMIEQFTIIRWPSILK